MSNLFSPAVGRITSGFGPRKALIPGMSTYHKGVDIADVDDAIVAAADGVVVKSANVAGRGNYVTIDIGAGVHVLVQHLASRGVAVGQRVAAGQWLGKEGRTGNVTGVHCHLEVIVNGVNVDPAAWFAAHGVTLGALGTGTWNATTTAAPATGAKAYQQRQNRFGAAGLKEDGIPGKFTQAWEAWAMAAQHELNRWKSNLPKLGADGDYAAKTHARVRELQSRNGLPVTGYLSNADVAYMRRHGSKLADRPRTH